MGQHQDGEAIGFLHKATWRNVRLELRAIFRLSVLAMGRNVLKISARLMAGMGDVEDGGVGADVTEPEDDLRAMP